MKLWAWLQCLTAGHLPVWMGNRREGPTLIAVYRCKHCKRFSETRYRTEEKHIARGIHANRGTGA